MKNKKQTFSRRVIAVIANPKFFWGVMALFVFQAMWIALTARYPMAFDEDFHLGVIRVYAQQLSPFLSNQPPGSETFGALTSDPSYFYHYVMSFPYRLISHFTANQTTQVLLLRMINITFFSVGLILFRKVLLATGASRALAHASLLIFVLFPIVPLVAGQINYDNVLLPLFAGTLLLTIRVSNQLTRHKQISIADSIWLVVLMLMVSIVKYAFLPILLAISLYLIIVCFKTFPNWKTFSVSLRKSYRNTSKKAGWLLISCLIVASSLFAQRYVVNIARYHTPVPDCSQVLTIEQCSNYGPWARDYNHSQNKLSVSHSPFNYAGEWFYGMWLRTFFSVDGPSSLFQTRGPLLLPAIISIALPLLTVVAALFSLKSVFRRYNASVLWLFFLISAFYIAALWLNGYKSFIETDRPVAINGRYLLIVYPLIILIAGLVYSEIFRRRSEALKLGFATVIVICLIWGGGVLTYILRSNETWYWPNSTVVNVNKTLQRNIGPFVPGYNQPTQFLR